MTGPGPGRPGAPAAPAFRLAAWSGLALFIIAETALYYAGTTRGLGMLARDIPFLAIILAATVAAIVAAARASGREVRLWTYLALASGLQLVAELLVGMQDAFGLPARAAVTASSIAGLFSLGATVAVFALLFSMSPMAERPLTERIRAGLDITALILLAVAGAQFAQTGLVLESWGVSLDTQLLASTRLVLGMALLAGVAFNVFGFRGRSWNSWDRLLSLSLALTAVGLLLWPLYYIGEFVYGWWIAGLLTTFVFGASEYIALIAAVTRLLAPGPALERPRIGRDQASSSTAEAILLPSGLLAATAVVFLLGWADPGSDVSRFVAFPVVVVASALLAVRTVLLRVSGAVTAAAARTDPVSGAYALAPFAGFLQEQYDYSIAAGESFSLVEVDIDGFGGVNDRAGHRAGDALLGRVAAALGDAAPRGATVFRSGADAFAVTLPGASPGQAYEAAVQMVRAVASASEETPVTASAGVATVDGTLRDGDDLREAASAALTAARASGHGLVASHSDDTGRHGPTKTESSFLRIAHGLVDATEERTEFRRGHGERVSETAGALANEAGLSQAQVETVRLAGRLHDLGKLAVPDRVLDKPGALDEDEERLLHEHPVLASRMLAPAGDPDLRAWVGDHHERWDGSGYPLGLAGEGISQGGRIIAIADEWENLLARQPTRRALSTTEAVARITAGSGMLWDPELLEVFLSLVARTR